MKVDYQNTWTLLESFLKEPVFWVVFIAFAVVIGSIGHYLLGEIEYRKFIKANNGTDEGESL